MIGRRWIDDKEKAAQRAAFSQLVVMMAPVMVVNAAMVMMIRPSMMMVAPHVMMMTPRVMVMLHLLHHTAFDFNRNRGQWRCDTIHGANAEAKHCSEK